MDEACGGFQGKRSEGARARPGHGRSGGSQTSMGRLCHIGAVIGNNKRLAGPGPEAPWASNPSSRPGSRTRAAAGQPVVTGKSRSNGKTKSRTTITDILTSKTCVVKHRPLKSISSGAPLLTEDGVESRWRARRNRDEAAAPSVLYQEGKIASGRSEGRRLARDTARRPTRQSRLRGRSRTKTWRIAPGRPGGSG